MGFQLISLGPLPTCILCLTKVLVNISKRGMRLDRLWIRLRSSFQLWQCPRSIPLSKEHLAVLQIRQEVIGLDL